MNDQPFAEKMFQAEARGLELLGEHIRTPRVVGIGSDGGWSFLMLEYIHQGKRTPQFWKRFGEALATLHQSSRSQFGLDYDNYIGALPQENTAAEKWPDFYCTHRLEPQVALAVDKGLLWEKAHLDLEKLYKNLPDICPEEAPALTHGDLWGGNFLTTTENGPALIDPAVSFAHREMDLGMSRLFGGFSHVFYEAYEAHYPTAPGLEDRLGIYQLYYLLAHVNLFGKSYTQAVQNIVERYT
jgi:hypothetical protein